ncbi:MAG TPA: hypothetical protein VGT61_04650 [Thermomicrobiales bacterium]|jgi:hypothetical protein|nr:hypothetical protein [Thermomicrobiales bacterium]
MLSTTLIPITTGNRVARSLRVRRARPSCPVCPGRRSTDLVRIEIEEIPGLSMSEVSDWRCAECGAVVRQVR